jgi:hypothetical protein
MEITELRTESNGTRSVEIRAGTLSYRALLRCIRGIPEASVAETSHDPLNDNTRAEVIYKGVVLTLDTPFSDYIINCTSPSDAFDEFVSRLRGYRVRWWDRFL